MRFLTTDTQTAIPVDVQFIPWCATKYIRIDHVWKQFDQQDQMLQPAQH
jgi:hypothetical protein